MRSSASRFIAAVVVALAGACTGITCAARDAGLTPAQVEEMLEAHNGWRRMVNVKPLRWSSDLAARAQAYAERLASAGCGIQHSRRPRNIGENLLSLSIGHLVPAQVVNSWAAEAAYYDRGRNQCASGKQCAHYTQIVWSGTREVGCAAAVCEGAGQVWVCNYQPAGNVVGQRPF